MPTDAVPAPVHPSPALSRRGFLRAATITGGGLVAAVVAACAPSAQGPAWTFGPTTAPGGAGSTSPTPVPATAVPSTDPGHVMPSGSPADGTHDANALEVVQRFLGGEATQVEGLGNQPYGDPVIEGGVKVFNLTVDEIQHRIDARMAPLDGLGFNGTWPGPRIDVIEGDRIRAVFKNNMRESTGIHFHGQRVPNNMDGVPHVTQDPIMPGDSFAYEFTADPSGSHMYHSHHNATNQVGRGLLGAFIVHPKDPALRAERRYGISQDIVWISNDAFGGFTINGRGFPATEPIVAKLGDRILIRFMNEGNMMHPWHLHGVPMQVVARDGHDLGSAAFTCDTLGVNPGERWDVLIDCTEPGAWAFHCHILQHAEGADGMFGMVTALVIQDPASAAIQRETGATAALAAASAAGSTALTCQIRTS